jgi:hypothetical protein
MGSLSCGAPYDHSCCHCSTFAFLIPAQNDTAAILLSRPAAVICVGPPWTTARVADLSHWFPVAYRSPGVVQVAPLATANTLALFDGRKMYTLNTEFGYARGHREETDREKGRE